MSRSDLPKSAVGRAIEFGIDISLLIENLKLTPTERLMKLQQVLNSLESFRQEVAKARAAQKDAGWPSGDP